METKKKTFLELAKKHVFKGGSKYMSRDIDKVVYGINKQKR